MKKIIVGLVLMLLVLSVLSACAGGEPETIKIGINAPLTGDIPKVGEGTKFAAEMWLEDIEKADGLQVGDNKYKVELVIEDNEAKAESAVKANTCDPAPKKLSIMSLIGTLKPSEASAHVSPLSLLRSTLPIAPT